MGVIRLVRLIYEARGAWKKTLGTGRRCAAGCRLERPVLRRSLVKWLGGAAAFVEGFPYNSFRGTNLHFSEGFWPNPEARWAPRCHFMHVRVADSVAVTREKKGHLQAAGTNALREVLIAE